MDAFRIFDEQPSNSPLTVADVFRLYLAYINRRVREETFTAEHRDNIQRDHERFLAFLGGNRAVADCRQYDLTQWLLENPQWKSANSKRNAVSSVLVAMAWAEDEDLIDHSPYRRPRLISASKYVPRRPASHQEIVKLMRNGSRYLRRALQFLWETGARTCEMRNVRWIDVHLDHEHPHIRLDRHKTVNKTGKPRYIMLNVRAVRLLRRMLPKRRSEFVFTNTLGRKWDRHTFARMLRRVAQRSGLDDGVVDRVSAYCLRHTWTCDFLSAGGHAKEAADLLGHTDSSMVERIYGSHMNGRLDYLARANEKRANTGS